MPTFNATCTSTKTLINGLKYAEFSYKHDYIDKYLREVKEFYVDLETYPSNENTEADDFKLRVYVELEWIPESYLITKNPKLLYIEKIILKSCSKDVCGEIELHPREEENEDSDKSEDGSEDGSKDESESEDEVEDEPELKKEKIFKFRDTDTDGEADKCTSVTFPTKKMQIGKRNFVFKVYYSEKDRVRETVYDYEPYFADKSMSDVTIVFPEHDDEEIPAHRVILAAHNEVFAKMFKSEMLEKNDKLEIQDIEPNIFKLLLRYIYSKKLVCYNKSELAKLMVAANTYSVRSLVDICDERLATKRVDFTEAVELLISADLVRANKLKMKCIDVIIEDKSYIISGKKYKELLVKSGRADLISELFCRSVTKQD